MTSRRGRIGLGVIGLGFGQQVHVPAFRAAGFDVRALCGKRLHKAQEVAQALGIEKAYGDWRALLKDPEIQAVSIAVPPALQPAIVCQAAALGKHVFCEKPLAATFAQVQKMIRGIDRAPIIHTVDFLFPELRTWQKARTLITRGSLGRIRSIALTWRVETMIYRKNFPSWKRLRAQGGGTLNNFVSHSLYALEWMLGPVTRLSARLRPARAVGDARVDLWLEFSAGFSGSVSVAADAFKGPGHRLDVYGDQGTLMLDNPSSDYVSGFSLSLCKRSQTTWETVVKEPAIPGHDGRADAVAHLARRFYSAIQTHQDMRPNLYDGLRVQKLMDAIRKSDRLGTWCSVNA